MHMLVSNFRLKTDVHNITASVNTINLFKEDIIK